MTDHEHETQDEGGLRFGSPHEEVGGPGEHVGDLVAGADPVHEDDRSPDAPGAMEAGSDAGEE